MGIFLTLAQPVMAIVNPLAVPNNRVGVHILDSAEIESAVKLVNSNGGDWGYVTIVLRSNDLDREKWTTFFTNARRWHVIPIVRLATYPDGGTWVKPDALDLVDFANFLSDMPWPVKNRYVVMFNEVNHAAEWGEEVNPLEYATLLLDAQRIFKARSDDFFLISAGLDMSSSQTNQSWDALNFYRRISFQQPKWYTAIDGIAVHAYPNPAFSSPPHSKTRYGISSYTYEQKLLQSLGYTPKPIFITETGWPHEQPFFTTAFTQIWQDPQIVAITPFLLSAGAGDFARFSLLTPSQSPKQTYREIYDLSKKAGSPLLADVQITSTTAFSSGPLQSGATSVWRQKITSFWQRITGTRKITVGQTGFTVEIAQTEVARQRGLSGRSKLGEGQGMLFNFDQPDRHSFWMKDMQFGLDFVWIRGGKVVEITTQVPPPSQTNNQPQIVTPSVKVDQVLEITAGSTERYGLQVGDVVQK